MTAILKSDLSGMNATHAFSLPDAAACWPDWGLSTLKAHGTIAGARPRKVVRLIFASKDLQEVPTDTAISSLF
jgi:hypothetical protein